MEKVTSVSCFRLFCVITVMFSFLVNPDLHAQDETAVRKFVTARDMKRLNKANQIRNEADKLSEKATTLKADIRKYQHDSGLEEKVIKKKVRLLQSQSWQKEFQASALYEKSNDITYNIYKRYLNRFWKEHEGEEAKYMNAKVIEEQARDNYSQARVYRRRTKHMNLGNAKIEKLSEAKNLEAVAIRRQVTSLTSCLAIPEAMAKTEVPLNPVEPDTAKNIAQTPAVSKPEPAPEPAPKPAPERKEVRKDTITAPPVNVPAVKAPEPAAKEPLSVPKETRTPPAKNTEKAPGVLFRIQIAASRVPLTFSEFENLYKGNYPVEAVSEGGWLKYQLLGQLMYSEVQRIFREVNIKGAFIVAYRNGVKQNPAEMIKENRELEKKLLSEGNTVLPDYTEYHVELKTSKTALKPAEIAKLYNGPEPVALIMEKGLFEYHLNAGNSAETAKNLRQKTGAAIVSYRHSIRTAATDIQ